MPTNPAQMFQSDDQFEHMTRAEIAEDLNLGVEESEIVDTNDVEQFDPDDDRLTDEVCQEFVNWMSNCGDCVESALETLEAFPHIRQRAR
jgi:hypothetical protein